MSNNNVPGSNQNVNVQVRALTIDPAVTVQYKTKILHKNLVNGVNTLTQAMMNETNTKYVVKYDYVLGENITVPADCVLEFQGGTLKNGKIIGNQTVILAGDYQIFTVGVTKYRGYSTEPLVPGSPYSQHYGFVSKVYGDDVEISGTWNNSIVSPSWVGLDNIVQSECSRKKLERFIKLHKSGMAVSIPYNTYFVYGILDMRQSLDFNESTVKCCYYKDIYDGSIPLPEVSYPLPSDDIYGLEMVDGLINIKISSPKNYLKNVTIDGNRGPHYDDVQAPQDGENYEAIKYGMGALIIPYYTLNDFTFENVHLLNTMGCGLTGGNIASATFNNFEINGITEHGIYERWNDFDIVMNDCKFHNCGDSQRMITARQGAGYLWKAEATQDEHVGGNITFNRCSFTNDTSLQYRAFFHFYANLNITFNECYQNISYCSANSDFSKSVIYNRSENPLIETLTAKNLEISINECKGNSTINNAYKNIKNSDLKILYIGTPNNTFEDSTKQNETVNLENCNLTYVRYQGTGRYVNTVDIYKIAVKDCVIGVEGTLATSNELMTAANKVEYRGCIIAIDCPLISLGNPSIKLEFCVLTALLGYYLIRTEHDIEINNITVTKGTLIAKNSAPNNVVDNTVRGINGISGDSSTYIDGLNAPSLLANIVASSSAFTNITRAAIGAQGFASDIGKTLVVKSIDGNGKPVFVEYDGAAPAVTRVSTDSNRPVGSKIFLGFRYYDRTLNQPIYASYISGDNVTWRKPDGSSVNALRSGTKGQRPLGNYIYVGFQFMQVDTTYGTFPIWASAISGNTVTWVKADGTNPDV